MSNDTLKAEAALPLETGQVDIARLVEPQVLRWGTNRSRLGDPWSQLPYSVIGQAATGVMYLQIEGHKAQQLRAGGGYVIPAGMRHRGWTDEPVTFHWMHVSFRVMGAADLVELLDMPVLFPKAGPHLRDLRMSLPDESDTTANADRGDATIAQLRDIARRQTVAHRLLEFVLEHARGWRPAAAVLRHRHRLGPVLQFIEGHLQEALSREQLADLASLSPSRFHTLFREVMGTAPMQYVKQVRLRRAQELLAYSDLSIAEVGSACGYRDQFHFSRLFKQETGMSPLKYRQSEAAKFGRGL